MGCFPAKSFQVKLGDLQKKGTKVEDSKFANGSHLGPSMVNIDQSVLKSFQDPLICQIQKEQSRHSNKTKKSDKCITQKISEEFEHLKAFERNLNHRRTTHKVMNSKFLEKLPSMKVGVKQLFTMVQECPEEHIEDKDKQEKQPTDKKPKEMLIPIIPEESPEKHEIQTLERKGSSTGGQSLLKKSNFMTSKSVIVGDSCNTPQENSNANSKNKNKFVVSGRYVSNISDITPTHTDYSSMDDEKSVLSNYSPAKILRKYNLNPYHNFNVVKKFFIYQLKKAFLQAKKLAISNAVHGNAMTNNNKANYHEIFSNYSQINSNNVDIYEKYEDHNIRINDYYIYRNKQLGKGGYSTVYLCQNIKNKKEYAVKVTDKKVRANAMKKKYDYVKDEVNILKRLHSRYIVQVYEILESKNECFIVMELMKNNSLFSKISTLDSFRLWKYFRNLICGVEHCHEIAKIVHRDINVNNLLISNEDTLKVSDFGISLIIEDDDDSIPCNSGPSTYLPPEKNPRSSVYGGRAADMWLIGVTLFHMVYRRPLFKNFANLTEEDYNIILPDDAFNEDELLKELLLKLLDPNPETRCTFNDLKKNKWVTKNDEFPLPDIHEEALEYCYYLTSKEIEGVREEKENCIGEIKLLHENNSLSPTNI